MSSRRRMVGCPNKFQLGHWSLKSPCGQLTPMHDVDGCGDNAKGALKVATVEDEVSSNKPTPNDGPSARMARYWNSSATAPWVTLQDRLDALLGPAGDAAIREANPIAGEHVLDVGCGCGGSTLEFARLVGKLGHVTGIDISDQMLARARERVVETGSTQVTLAVADAGSYAFEPASFDHLYSRLGIMFFGAPVAAF